MGRYGDDPLADHGIDLNAMLVELIDQSGRTRYDLAAELGISQATLSKAYTGKRAATLELVCLVASATGRRVTVGAKKVTS